MVSGKHSPLRPALGKSAEALFRHRDHAHFLVLFANQRFINLPQYAHSFAIFGRITRERGRPRLDDQETFCLSWLPKRLEISIFGDPEPGSNMSLETTLAWAASINTRVTALGPYLIKPELHRKAHERRLFLESEIPQFVVLDGAYRPHRATNCIHAISDLGLTPEPLRTGMAYGVRASQKIASYFRPWIEGPAHHHPWLAELLGLDGDAIQFSKLAG